MKKVSTRKLANWTAVLAVFAIATAPISASAVTTNSSIEATVNSVISVTSSGTVPISVTPDADGNESTAASDTVSVSSNDADGYNLTLANSDATTTMAGFRDDGVTSNGATLAAASGTYGTPAALGVNTWGWRVDSLGTFGVGGTTTYAGVPATSSPQNIRSTTAVASSEVTTVKYAVNVSTAVPNGIYKDTVTYTATVK